MQASYDVSDGWFNSADTGVGISSIKITVKRMAVTQFVQLLLISLICLCALFITTAAEAGIALNKVTAISDQPNQLPCLAEQWKVGSYRLNCIGRRGQGSGAIIDTFMAIPEGRQSVMRGVFSGLAPRITFYFTADRQHPRGYEVLRHKTGLPNIFPHN